MCAHQAQKSTSSACIKISSILALLILCSCQRTEPLARVYLASSLAPLATELRNIALIEKLNLDLIFLTSSIIVKHIDEGAPCDAVVLADEELTRRLVSRGRVDHRRVLATNRLVVATSDDTLKKMADLTQLNRTKIIIADPDYVPLGRYSKEALEKIGVFRRWSEQFIVASSARHATMLLKQRLASVAILYATDAIHEQFQIIYEFNADMHRPAVYDTLICRDGKYGAIIEKLLFSRRFQHVLEANGFNPYLERSKAALTRVIKR